MGWRTSGSPAKSVARKPSDRVMRLGASLGANGLSAAWTGAMMIERQVAERIRYFIDMSISGRTVREESGHCPNVGNPVGADLHAGHSPARQTWMSAPTRCDPKTQLLVPCRKVLMQRARAQGEGQLLLSFVPGLLQDLSDPCEL